MNKVYTTRCLTVTGIALMLALQAVGAQSPDNASGGNAIAGQQLYFDHACYACHGYTGETGVRALVGSGVLVNEETFRTFLRLRADQNPTLPSTQMPNYPEESLSDEAVGDLYAYIRTFKSNAPELEDIPVLNSIIDAASR
jgi:mono/diheme cytochrome c family protein